MKYGSKRALYGENMFKINYGNRKKNAKRAKYEMKIINGASKLLNNKKKPK